MGGEINGDAQLSGGDRVRYLWRNLRRNLGSLGQARGSGPRMRGPDRTRDVAGRIATSRRL